MTRALLFDQLTPGLSVPGIPIPETWTVTRFDSPIEAGAALSDESFDVVVSLAGMPTEEGITFLVQTRDVAPEAVRLLVTADPGMRATVSLNRVAHEHLVGPITVDQLEDVFARTVAMHQHLSSVRLRSAMAKVQSLPAFPRLYNQIVEELERSEGDLSRIARVVMQDPGLTARVLQLVNSPFYGLRRQVHDTAQAVGLLGIQNLLSMVLATEVFTDFDSAGARLNVNKMWTHAATTALWAKRIVEFEGRTLEEANLAFVAGILHDSGRMILGSNFPVEHANVVGQLETEANPDIISIERSVLGASHAEAGAYLLDTWELPTLIVEAVAYHHEPSRSDVVRFTPLTAVHVAEVFQQEVGADGVERDIELDMVHLDKLGLSGRVDQWRVACGLEDA
jgi:HD-like signal output (HDOD) protein